ncbi:MAG: hypothetical protein OEZ13_07790 [Spirochaetia bacterium]|nr:hypothetical protein [Spirochaetia bacterium]
MKENIIFRKMILYLNILFSFLFKRIYLIIFLLKKHALKNIAATFGLFLTLIILIFSLGMIRPLKSKFIETLKTSLPAEFIKIKSKKAPEKSLLFSLFGSKQGVNMGISTRQIREMKKWPHVEKVTYTQVLQSPALMYVEHPALSSVAFQMDMIFQGIDASVVKPYLSCMNDFRPKRKILPKGGQRTVIPIVVPESYIDLIQSYAVMIPSIPVIKKESAIGIEMPVQIGRSVLMRNAELKEIVNIKLCGFVPDRFISSAGVPLLWVQGKHRQWKMINALNSYDQVFITASNTEKAEEIRKIAQKRGYLLNERETEYSQLYEKLSQIDIIFWSAALILLIVSLISLFNSFSLIAIKNKYEFGLCMVFGSSIYFIWFIMFLEGAIWGFIYSLAAFYISENMFVYIQQSAKNLPLIGETIINQNNLLITAKEKLSLIFATALLAGCFSLLPTIILTAKKTIQLVKKD